MTTHPTTSPPPPPRPAPPPPRRLRAMTTLLVLPLLLLALLGLAACGDDGGGGDGVASIDPAGAADDQGSDDSGDGGGDSGGGPANDPEVQDAMLEYAECMRDQGVDMPDPEFTADGGVSIGGPPGKGGPGEGPDGDEFQEADDACRPIMEEAMPEPPELDPEERAELQDRLVEAAECMREKGYDMPDPEVDDKGRVTIRGGGPDSSGGNGPRGADEDDEFREDMEECGGGPPRVRGGDGDGGDTGGTDTDTESDDDSNDDDAEGTA